MKEVQDVAEEANFLDEFTWQRLKISSKLVFRVQFLFIYDYYIVKTGEFASKIW